MRARNRVYRFPGGDAGCDTTKDSGKYSKAWENFYSPLKKELQAHVVGFDPGVLFILPSGQTQMFSEESIFLLNKVLPKGAVEA